MLNNKGNASGGGIGVIGLLGVCFVVLKLMNIINWSWWYVTMPFWAGFAAIIALLLLTGFFILLTKLLNIK